MRSAFQGPVLASALAGLLLLPGCQPSGEQALIDGDKALQAGQTDAAITAFELAATKLPTNGEVWNRLGLAYHAAGRLQEAHKAYLRALEFNRNLFDVRFNLGELHLELGQFREAAAEYRTYLNASADNARNPDAWRGIGLALQALRQFQDAETALSNATRLDSADPEAWNALGLVRIQNRRPREAYQAFLQAAQAAPDFPPARLNLAVTAQQHFNDRRTALGHYRDFLTLQPSGPEADAVRATVQDLEVRLGLARPPQPSNTVTPSSLTATSHPPESVTVAHAASNRPPAVARTNPPPRPPIVLTSTPPAVAAPPSNPPRPAVVLSNPPQPTRLVTTVATAAPPTIRPSIPTNPAVARVTPPRPAPQTNPPPAPLEVVQVTPEPTPRRANDDARPTTPPTTTPPPSTSPVPTRLAVPIPESRPPESTLPIPPRDPAPVATTTPPPAPNPAPNPAPDADPGVAEDPSRPRRGFWGKVNPVNWGNPVKWFRKDGPALPEVPDREAAQSPAARAASKVTPLPVLAPARPDWPRFNRVNPIAPAHGNRTAADAEYQRGALAHQKGDLRGASNAYRRAIALDPAHFESHHNLTLIALQEGDLPTSLQVGELAVALDPASPNARYNLAVALQRSRYPLDAADELARVTERQPDDPNAHLALATLYAGDLADATRARFHYQRVLDLKPDHAQAANIRRWLERHPAP